MTVTFKPDFTKEVSLTLRFYSRILHVARHPAIVASCKRWFTVMFITPIHAVDVIVANFILVYAGHVSTEERHVCVTCN